MNTNDQTIFSLFIVLMGLKFLNKLQNVHHYKMINFCYYVNTEIVALTFYLHLCRQHVIEKMHLRTKQ